MRFAILLFLSMFFGLAQARMPDVEQQTRVEIPSDDQLETILAPIALYPDSLLSHILIAATYPLEVIQAARWREQHQHLDAETARREVEEKNWSPSVKALVPFHSLLQQLNKDLDWLQALGNAFLQDEKRLLHLVQNLRTRAYESGNLTNNQYVQVQQQKEYISIQPVEERIIYVPSYDTRIVYGHWSHTHHPVNWYSYHHSDHPGFSWSLGFSIRPHFYFSNVHWHDRYIKVSHHYYRPHTYHKSYTRAVSHEYKRWQHNSHKKYQHYTHKRSVSHEYQKPQQQTALRNKSHSQKRFVNPGYKPKTKSKVLNAPLRQYKHMPKKRVANNGHKQLKQYSYHNPKAVKYQGQHKVKSAQTTKRYKQYTHSNSGNKQVVRKQSRSKQYHR